MPLSNHGYWFTHLRFSIGVGLLTDILVDYLLPVTDNYIPFENQLLAPAKTGMFIPGTSMTATRTAHHELGSNRLTKS